MAVVNPPLALQGPNPDGTAHPAETFRMMAQALSWNTEGVWSPTDLKVTGNGLSMDVSVANGVCLIRGNNRDRQGSYICYADSATSVTIAAADPTNPRYDLIVAQVKDSIEDSGADDEWGLYVVQGTPAGSPTVPAVPDNSIPLAHVRVEAAVTVITNAKVTDRRYEIREQLPENWLRCVISYAEGAAASGWRTAGATPLYDPSAMYNAGTKRITAARAGIYRIEAMVRNQSHVGAFFAGFAQNGAGGNPQAGMGMVSNGLAYANPSWIAVMQAGDYVTMQFYTAQSVACDVVALDVRYEGPIPGNMTPTAYPVPTPPS